MATTVDPGFPSAESIKERGWRQWSCVATTDIPWVRDGATCGRVSSETEVEGTRLLVVTQSCDLVHHDYKNEPVVETFACESLGPDHQPDGNFTAGKNPRTLLVQFAVEGVEGWFRLCSNGRALVPRHRFATIDPDASVTLTDRAVRTLQRWILNRVLSLGDKPGGGLPPF